MMGWLVGLKTKIIAGLTVLVGVLFLILRIQRHTIKEQEREIKAVKKKSEIQSQQAEDFAENTRIEQEAIQEALRNAKGKSKSDLINGR